MTPATPPLSWKFPLKSESKSSIHQPWARKLLKLLHHPRQIFGQAFFYILLLTEGGVGREPASGELETSNPKKRLSPPAQHFAELGKGCGPHARPRLATRTVDARQSRALPRLCEEERRVRREAAKTACSFLICERGVQRWRDSERHILPLRKLAHGPLSMKGAPAVAALTRLP